MTNFTFAQEMTADEVEAARKAAEFAGQQLDGHKLMEGLAIGKVLLQGSQLAEARAGANKGKAYAIAFAAFKEEFGFRRYNDQKEQKRVNNFFDDAVLCAKHSEAAEKILNELGPVWRANNGVSGLAKRLRVGLRKKENIAAGFPPEGPKKAPKSKSEVEGLKAEIFELQNAYNSQKEKMAELEVNNHALKSGAPAFDLSPAGAKALVAEHGATAAKAFVKHVTAAIDAAKKKAVAASRAEIAKIKAERGARAA